MERFRSGHKILVAQAKWIEIGATLAVEYTAVHHLGRQQEKLD